MTNYALEAQIAKEMDELLGRSKKPTVALIRKALKDSKKGPRHEAAIQANAEEWLIYLLKVIKDGGEK